MIMAIVGLIQPANPRRACHRECGSQRRQQQQHRKLGNVIIYLDDLTLLGVFIRLTWSQPREALQSELPEE